MKMKTTLLALLACFSLSMVKGATINIESSTLNNNSDDSDLLFNLVDETGGNTSSILLVGVSARLFNSGSFDEITIDYGTSTDVSGTLLGAENEFAGNNGTVIYGFDLGNVSGPQSITINNTSTQTTDEVFEDGPHSQRQDNTTHA